MRSEEWGEGKRGEEGQRGEVRSGKRGEEGQRVEGCGEER